MSSSPRSKHRRRAPSEAPVPSRRRFARVAAVGALLGALGACTVDAPPAVRPGRGFWVGVASWYGEPFHGRRTASGEVYDMNGLTAAHRSLPFGTKLRVTHLNNGRTVVVEITDRGPFIRGREIDLSRGAAQALAMVNEGIAHVRLERLN